MALILFKADDGIRPCLQSTFLIIVVLSCKASSKHLVGTKHKHANTYKYTPGSTGKACLRETLSDYQTQSMSVSVGVHSHRISFVRTTFFVLLGFKIKVNSTATAINHLKYFQNCLILSCLLQNKTNEYT